MSAPPAIAAEEVPLGTSWTPGYQLQDSAGSNLDLSSATVDVTLRLRLRGGTTVTTRKKSVAGQTSYVTDGTDGKIRFLFSAGEDAALTSGSYGLEYVYEETSSSPYHELRTPLAAIENYLRAMMADFAGDLTAKQERMVKRSILRITYLSAMIGDVVDLARMRPEQIQADFEWFDPGEVGTESIEDARLAAAEKDIHLKIEPPPQFEPIVGARRRIRQVFSNLLNNAIKYAPAGSTVIFRAWYEPQAVCFEGEDQGPGIPAEDLPYVFHNFFRASNVGETTGAGLGLSIAQKIMEAHDGQILISNVIQEDGQTGVRITVVTPRNLKTPEMMRREWSDSAGEGSGMVFR